MQVLTARAVPGVGTGRALVILLLPVFMAPGASCSRHLFSWLLSESSMLSGEEAKENLAASLRPTQKGPEYGIDAACAGMLQSQLLAYFIHQGQGVYHGAGSPITLQGLVVDRGNTLGAVDCGLGQHLLFQLQPLLCLVAKRSASQSHSSSARRGQVKDHPQSRPLQGRTCAGLGCRSRGPASLLPRSTAPCPVYLVSGLLCSQHPRFGQEHVSTLSVSPRGTLLVLGRWEWWGEV